MKLPITIKMTLTTLLLTIPAIAKPLAPAVPGCRLIAAISDTTAAINCPQPPKPVFGPRDLPDDLEKILKEEEGDEFGVWEEDEKLETQGVGGIKDQESEAASEGESGVVGAEGSQGSEKKRSWWRREYCKWDVFHIIGPNCNADKEAPKTEHWP